MIEQNNLASAVKNCILEAKRQIYLRKNSQDRLPDLIEVDKLVRVADFGPSDKQRVVSSLLSHAQIFDMLCQLLQSNQGKPQPVVSATQALPRPCSSSQSLLSRPSTSTTQSVHHRRFKVQGPSSNSESKKILFNMRIQ